MTPQIATPNFDDYRPSLFQQLLNFFFGYDFFICYAHADGKNYATALFAQLRDDFECFLDTKGFAAGDRLQISDRVALHRTGCLILIGTPAALTSKWVKWEVDEFSRQKRRIIPINIGHALDEEVTAEKIFGIPFADIIWIPERAENMSTQPSPAVITRLRDSFNLTRQKQKRIRSVATAAVLFALIAVLAASLGLLARQRQQVAETRLVNLYVDRCVSEMNSGDYSLSLPWGAKALMTESRQQANTNMHRMRLAYLRKKNPRLEAIVFHEHKIPSVKFDAQANRIVTAGWDNQAKIVALDSGKEIRLKHDDLVTDATFSFDGKWVATASHDKRVRVWESSSGRLISSSFGHDDSVNSVSFDSTGKWLLTLTSNGMVRIWDPSTGKTIFQPPKNSHEAHFQDSFINDAHFSSDGKRIITAGKDGTASIWDLSGEVALIQKFRHGAEVHTVVSAADNRRIATLCGDDIARVWSVDSPERPLIETRVKVTTGSIALSPDGHRLAVARYDYALVWDVDSGKPITPRLSHDDYIPQISFDTYGRRLLTSSWDGSARIWDVENGVARTPPLRSCMPLNGAQFSRAGDIVATASDGGTVRIWNVSEHTSPDRFLNHGSLAVNDAKFSPNGEVLATAAADGTAYLWNLATLGFKTIQLDRSAQLEEIQFDQGGRRLMARQNPNQFHIWDIPHSRRITPEKGVHFENPDGIARLWFSPSGDRVLLLNPIPAIPYLWFSETREWKRLDTDIAMGAAFDSNGKQIAIAAYPNYPNAINIWNHQLQRVHELPFEHKSMILKLLFTDNDQQLVVAKHTGVEVWDIQEKRMTRRLSPREGQWLNNILSDVDVDENARLIVAGSNNGTARVWSLSSGEIVAPPLRHSGEITNTSFGRNAEVVVTTSLDGTARVWDTQTGAAVTPALKHNSRYAATINDENSLLVTIFKGQVHLHDLSPEKRSPEEISQTAQLLSAHRVDEMGGLVRLTPSEIKKLYEDVR